MHSAVTELLQPRSNHAIVQFVISASRLLSTGLDLAASRSMGWGETTCRHGRDNGQDTRNNSAAGRTTKDIVMSFFLLS